MADSDPHDEFVSASDASPSKTPPYTVGSCLGTLLVSLFFALFLAAGLLMFWVAAIWPLAQSAFAFSWTAVPCTIISSEVVGKETFLIEIKYEYDFAGQRYVDDNFSYFNMRTSGRAAKENVVQQYPPGSQATCYVNPKAPAESVLDRSVRASIFWSLMGWPFFLVGVIGMVAIRRGKRPLPSTQDDMEVDPFSDESSRSSRRSSSSSTAIRVVSNSDFDDESLQEEPGPVTLKAETTPLAAFLVILVVALVWNGVVLAVSAFRIPDWLNGRWNWLPEFVLLPFGLIGLLLIWGTLHTFLALFNPIPILTLSRRLIPLGGRARISWKFRGSSGSIRQIKITLQGIEEARYTRGTDTSVDTAKFFDEVIFETSEPLNIEAGEAEILIPTETMHSFQGVSNKIKWNLNFQCEIPLWPDVAADFSIRVVPHE